MSSSVGRTASSPGSSGPRRSVACWLLTGDRKNGLKLVAKIRSNDAIYMKVLSASVARPMMVDPDAGMPRINRGMVYLGACLIAGIRLARERQVWLGLTDEQSSRMK
jgi:hypothetical protein